MLLFPAPTSRSAGRSASATCRGCAPPRPDRAELQPGHQRLRDDRRHPALSGWHLGSSEPIALFLHRITPARQTLDYGKSRVALTYGESDLVESALQKIAKPWLKYRERQIRGKKPTLPDEPKPERVSFKEAAFQAMAEAYAAASSNGQYPIIISRCSTKPGPRSWS